MRQLLDLAIRQKQETYDGPDHVMLPLLQIVTGKHKYLFGIGGFNSQYEPKGPYLADAVKQVIQATQVLPEEITQVSLSHEAYAVQPRNVEEYTGRPKDDPDRVDLIGVCSVWQDGPPMMAQVIFVPMDQGIVIDWNTYHCSETIQGPVFDALRVW